jgi:hypothetical protein
MPSAQAHAQPLAMIDRKIRLRLRVKLGSGRACAARPFYPQTADIVRPARHVRKVPIPDSSRKGTSRLRRGLESPARTEVNAEFTLMTRAWLQTSNHYIAKKGQRSCGQMGDFSGFCRAFC